MKQVDLVEIMTKDGLIHQGVYFEPPQKSKTALLYIHGFTSAFYHGLMVQNALVEACAKKGIGYASFNNRGHDYITSTYIVDKSTVRGKRHVPIGAGVEDFTKCIEDIDAGITFLKNKGYSSIILIGHSTGANKACYYMGNVNDNRVKGVVLAGPVCDWLIPTLKFLPIKRLMSRCLITLGLGNTIFTHLHDSPMTPRRALSLITPHSVEDVFDYGEEQPQLRAFRNIQKPLLVIISERDEYIDRPAASIKTVLDRYHTAKKYQSIIIKGALHGYDGKEKEFAQVIINWIVTI